MTEPLHADVGVFAATSPSPPLHLGILQSDFVPPNGLGALSKCVTFHAYTMDLPITGGKEMPVALSTRYQIDCILPTSGGPTNRSDHSNRSVHDIIQETLS